MAAVPKAKILYLANPYGFSSQQRRRLLPEVIHALEALGAEVWEPFTRNNQVDHARPDWAYEIGQRDVRDVRQCDAIFAIVNGIPPDEGVMVELGMAIALGKPTFLFRDDFRRCTDTDRYPLNLMLFAGLPATGWEDFYYTALEAISDPDKALVRWLKEP
jgi:nucleoside 2-deoxyribosyltransferase